LCKDNEDLIRALNDRILPMINILRTETFVSLAQQIRKQVQVLLSKTAFGLAI